MFHTEPNSPQHLKVGKIGEDIACKFLTNKGYRIIERNFRRKWGEIDIICIEKNDTKNSKGSIWNNIERFFSSKATNKNSILYETKNKKLIFVEVKTLKTNYSLSPEDNLTYDKQKKLIRTCQLYISEKNIDPDIEWQIDTILITLNTSLKRAKIRHLKGSIY